MNLFQLGNFTLHSGGKSRWIIDCRTLTTEDWAALAVIAMERFNLRFNEVLGIPEGGLAFANAMRPYAVSNSDAAVLIVDDVLTTGRSVTAHADSLAGEAILQAHRENRQVLALVAFARGSIKDREVHAIWKLG